VSRLKLTAPLLGFAGLVLATFVVGRSPSRADVELTVEPAMVRGAGTARVTIVEFSDYQ
jgi:hypothetical protein